MANNPNNPNAGPDGPRGGGVHMVRDGPDDVRLGGAVRHLGRRPCPLARRARVPTLVPDRRPLLLFFHDYG